MIENEEALDYLFLNPEKAWYDVPTHCIRCGKKKKCLVVPYAVDEETNWLDFSSLLKSLLEEAFAEIHIFTSFRDAPSWMEERVIVNRRFLTNEYGEIMLARCKVCETKQLYIPSQETFCLHEYDPYFWLQKIAVMCKVCGGGLYQIGDRDTVGYCLNESQLITMDVA